MQRPEHPALKALGRDWAAGLVSAVLEVPSAVVPLESNYLLNPRHPEFPSVRWSEPLPLPVDPRLLRS